MPAPVFATMLKILCEDDPIVILARAAERAERLGMVDRAALLRRLVEAGRINPVKEG